MLNKIDQIFAAGLPIALAGMIAAFIPQSGPEPDVQADTQVRLVLVQAGNAEALEAMLARYDFQWPPYTPAIPAIGLTQLPPDLDQVDDVSLKKSLFFRALLPVVLAENQALEGVRNHMLELFARDVKALGSSEMRWLKAVASHYRVKGDLTKPEVRELLLRRVDVIPLSLALAQAANESAWGSSRFAREGNNLFGIWTYTESKGIVPLGRPEGETYAVRAFSSIDASVRAYLHTLNTHDAYVGLRTLRQGMRERGERLDPLVLAGGLEKYSARGHEYIDEIRSMIRSNQLPSYVANLRFESES